MKQRLKTAKITKSGFSLVEVTLSIGIISFALLAVVALLPVGLKTVKNSAEQAAGAAVLEAIGEALRHASTTNGTNYSVIFSGVTNSFTLGAAPPPAWPFENLSLEGVADATNRRVVARLQILQTPSASRLTPGRAMISVAWSAAGNPTFDNATGKWDRAEGSLSAPIQFLPIAQ
jgi:type II secretory pathway pseudopilin PulG